MLCAQRDAVPFIGEQFVHYFFVGARRIVVNKKAPCSRTVGDIFIRSRVRGAKL